MFQIATSFSGSLVLIGLVFAIFVSFATSDRTAVTYNNCGVPINCATVEACSIEEPNCSKAMFNVLSAGHQFSTRYSNYPAGTLIAIMCSRDKLKSDGGDDGKPVVSQLEIYWRPDQGKTWFDISNVEGKPFNDKGMSVYFSEGQTLEVNTCTGGTCKPGNEDCLAFYDEWNHDARGMRACSPDFDMTLVICQYDSKLPEFGPLGPTIGNLGFLDPPTESRRLTRVVAMPSYPMVDSHGFPLAHDCLGSAPYLTRSIPFSL